MIPLKAEVHVSIYICAVLCSSWLPHTVDKKNIFWATLEKLTNPFADLVVGVIC